MRYGLRNYFKKSTEPLEPNEAEAYLSGRAPLWMGEYLVHLTTNTD